MIVDSDVKELSDKLDKINERLDSLERKLSGTADSSHELTEDIPSVDYAKNQKSNHPSTNSDLLTATDVRNKVLSTVRFTEGYDVGEVDDFLDLVAETLERLGRS